VAHVFGELDTEARAWLDAEDVPAEARRIAWHASLRYQHQGFELFVPWAGRDVTEAAAEQTGLVTVRGDREAATRLLTLFPRPGIEDPPAA